MTIGMSAATGESPVDEAQGQDLPSLVARCEPTLRRRALSLTGTVPEASDLVQDTMEHALRSLARFKAGSNLKVWLITIMKNLFLDSCRSLKVRRRVLRPVPTMDDLEAPAQAADDRDDVPLWARVSSEQFRAAAERLDPVLRDVFRLRAVNQLSYAQIALQTGIPASTVGTRLNRARARLKEMLLRDLQPDGPDHRPSPSTRQENL
jgi:RNA polymerase sigma-70 factor, ECF subfamily